jgi:hypothetical protein
MPLMRLQYRGRSDAERRPFCMRTSLTVKATLRNQSADRRHAASRKIVGLGMGCKDLEIYERWRHAVDKPIDRRSSAVLYEEFTLVGRRNRCRCSLRRWRSRASAVIPV